MEYHAAGEDIYLARDETSFVEITAKAAVNQIVIAVVAARRSRNVVIDGELTARVYIRDTTVATTPLVVCSQIVVLGVCHSDQASMPR